MEKTSKTQLTHTVRDEKPIGKPTVDFRGDIYECIKKDIKSRGGLLCGVLVELPDKKLQLISYDEQSRTVRFISDAVSNMQGYTRKGKTGLDLMWSVGVNDEG